MSKGVTRLTSNGGFVAAPGVISVDPVPATGQTLTDAATGGDHTATVEAGKSYLVVASATGLMFFGLAAVTTAANIAWICPANGACIINVPGGYTTLHYAGNTNGTTVYLTEIYRNPVNA